MTRDDMIQHLSFFVSQGISVPEQAFDMARTMDMARFERTTARQAALLVLRMALQRRFSFLTVRPSLLDDLSRHAEKQQDISLSPVRQLNR